MGVLLYADEVCRVLGFVQCFSGFDLCRVDTKKCKHSKQKKEFANIKINDVLNILSIYNPFPEIVIAIQIYSICHSAVH